MRSKQTGDCEGQFKDLGFKDEGRDETAIFFLIGLRQ